MTSASAVRAALVLGVMTFGRNAAADENHHQNYLVGERAVGMGGAYSALSNDPSGAYYNPAGIADAPERSLALTAAVYGFVGQQQQLLPDGERSDDNTFISYPIATAYVQRLGRGDESGVGRVQAALSFLTPTNHITRQRLFFIGEPTETPDSPDPLAPNFDVPAGLDLRVAEDESLWVGFSLGYRALEGLSLGASLFGTMRTGLYQFYYVDLFTTFDSTGEFLVDSVVFPDRTELSFTNFGLLGIIGAQLDLTSRLRLALVLRTPQLTWLSSGSVSQITTGEDPSAGLSVVSFDLDAEYKDRSPLKTTVGIAYRIPDLLTLSSDLSLYAPSGEYALLELTEPTTGERAEVFATKEKLLVQANLGAELYVSENFPVRAGFFTNLSSWEACDQTNPACLDSLNPFIDPIDRIGISGSLGYEIDRAAFTLGAAYNFGSGTNTFPGSAPVDRSVSYLLVLLGASFRFGAD